MDIPIVLLLLVIFITVAGLVLIMIKIRDYIISKVGEPHRQEENNSAMNPFKVLNATEEPATATPPTTPSPEIPIAPPATPSPTAPAPVPAPSSPNVTTEKNV